MELQIPEVPQFRGIHHGDHMWLAATSIEGEPNRRHVIDFVVRDWRQSEWSTHVSDVNNHCAPGSAYSNTRLANAKANTPHIKKTLFDLKGAFAGRTAYVILSGPSVLDDLKKNPPKPDDVVIAVNRGYVYSPYPVDYLLIGDGVIDAAMLDAWTEEHRMHTEDYSWSPIDRDSGGCALIAHQWSSPTLRERFGATNTYYMRGAGRGPENEQLGVDMKLPELEYTFCTGSMTVHLGDFLGCDELVFLGADNAYTHNMFHPYEIACAQKDTGYMILNSIHKRQLTITNQFMLVVNLKMEAWAYLLRKYNVRCVNLTGNGILQRFFERERIDRDATNRMETVPDFRLTAVPQMEVAVPA